MANVIFDSNSKVYLSNDGNATGSTVIGYGAGANIAAGDNFNVFIGHEVADANMTNAVQNVGIGYQALGALEDGDENVCIGFQAGDAITDGGKNIFIGAVAGGLLPSGSENIAIGTNALDAADGGEGGNIVIGTSAGGAIDHDDSDDNVIIGTNAGVGGDAAMGKCIAIGKEAMTGTANNAQSGTIAIGHKSLTALTSGARNLAIGYEAGIALTSSSDNIIIGYGAMDTATTNANKNIAIGNYALDACTATAVVGDNVAVGYNAGTGITDGDQNTFIGNYAGDEPTTGNNNTCIGYGSDTGAVGSSNQTAIGYACVAVNQDNSVTIGGAAVTNVYMSQDKDATVYCGGIQFGDDGEVLGAYEEGNWTPSFVTSNADGTFVYDVRTAKYTKIGNTVHCLAKTTMNGSGNTSGTGSLRITGLPFASDSNGYMYGNIAVGAASGWGTNVGAPTHGYVGPNVTIGHLRVYDNDGGNIAADVDVNAADMTNSTDIVYSVVYRVS